MMKNYPDSVMAFAYGRLGTSYGQLEQMDSARFYFEKGARRAKNHPNILGKILNNLHKQNVTSLIMTVHFLYWKKRRKYIGEITT